MITGLEFIGPGSVLTTAALAKCRGAGIGEVNSTPSRLTLVLLLFSRSVLSTVCDPIDCSTPGFPVLHQLLEVTQSHVHQVSDAIQPSHPLSSPSPPALNLSQHQDLF